MKRFAFALWLAATLAAPRPALAQETDYTTPEGAAFIHKALGPTMLAFQNQGDNDVIYFTNLLAWRCGTAAIMYGLNDDPPTTLFAAEPCYREFRDPNVLQHVGEPGFPFFLTVPRESAQKVTVRILYEDGMMAEFSVERAANLIP